MLDLEWSKDDDTKTQCNRLNTSPLHRGMRTTRMVQHELNGGCSGKRLPYISSAVPQHHRGQINNLCINPQLVVPLSYQCIENSREKWRKCISVTGNLRGQAQVRPIDKLDEACTNADDQMMLAQHRSGDRVMS